MNLQLELGSGPLDAPLWIIGRDFGAQEDKAQQPFVPSAAGVNAGMILNKALNAAGWERDSVRVDNVVPKRPAGNDWKAHTKFDMDWGMKRLDAMLKQYKPKLIVTLGNEASAAVLGGLWPRDKRNKPEGIQSVRGYLWDSQYGRVLTSVHPAAILRDWTPWRALLDLDFRKAKRELEASCPKLPKHRVTIVTSPDDLEGLYDAIEDAGLMGWGRVGNEHTFSQPDRSSDSGSTVGDKTRLSVCGQRKGSVPVRTSSDLLGGAKRTPSSGGSEGDTGVVDSVGPLEQQKGLRGLNEPQTEGCGAGGSQEGTKRATTVPQAAGFLGQRAAGGQVQARHSGTRKRETSVSMRRPVDKGCGHVRSSHQSESVALRSMPVGIGNILEGGLTRETTRRVRNEADRGATERRGAHSDPSARRAGDMLMLLHLEQIQRSPKKRDQRAGSDQSLFLAVDIENSADRKLSCVGFASSASAAWVIPAKEDWQLAAIEQLCGSEVPKVLQNGQYDRFFLARFADINLYKQAFDIMLGWHALQPELAGKKVQKRKGSYSRRTVKSLKFLASVYTRHAWWKDYDFKDDAERYNLCGIDCCETNEIAMAMVPQLEAI